MGSRSESSASIIHVATEGNRYRISERLCNSGRLGAGAGGAVRASRESHKSGKTLDTGSSFSPLTSFSQKTGRKISGC